MSRSGLLLAIILAIASISVLAQDTSQHAAPPSARATSSLVAKAQKNGTNNSAQPAATPSEEQTGSPADASNSVGANGQLPQTSTILPLLGLIGLGSLVAGLFARR